MRSNENEFLSQQLHQQAAQIKRLQFILCRYAGLKADLEYKHKSFESSVLSSASWRLTAPLRAVMSFLKGVKGSSSASKPAQSSSAQNAELAYCAFASSARINVLSPAADNSLALARSLSGLLLSLDIQSDVVPYVAYSLSAVPCIALDPPASVTLPPVYVLCHTSGPVDVSLSQSAFAVLESSASNLALYESDPSLSRKVYYLPCADSSELQFYFLRFLLAHDMLAFDAFYERTKTCFALSGDRLCLSMPESTKRRSSFAAEDPLGFAFFPGIRHRVGWLGCAMSYKYMAKLALDRGITELLICEDDVSFSPDFPSHFASVQAYLASHPGWDVFSGLMAEVDGVSPSQPELFEGISFLQLNRMVSMVFNVYNAHALQLLASWDCSSNDSSHQQIDQYLHSFPMRVITTSPFLVGHKAGFSSTLDGAPNARYNAMISIANKKLKNCRVSPHR